MEQATIPAAGRTVAPSDNKSNANFAAEEANRLRLEYEDLVAEVQALLDEARPEPKLVEDDDTALRMGALVKRFRDLDARIEKIRVVEKEPHLRRSEAVDVFFFVQRDRIGRRVKNKGEPGAADVLQARVDAYQQRKLAEAERVRAEAKRLAEEEERKARAAAAEAQRLADEAARAAERARKPETIEAKSEAAGQAANAAAEAARVATAAAQKATQAHVATLEKPADMVRTKGDDGVTLTMATEPYAVIENDALLDKEKLWPFIRLDAKEVALRAWAKNTGHTVPMAGAQIGKRPKSVIR